jgi:phospholipid transport system transporter-binding protein
MLDLEIARGARGAHWRFKGAVTSSTAAVLRSAPIDGGDELELDLSGVTEVDRAGLGAFLALVLHGRRLGVRVRILGAAPSVAAILRAEGIDRLVSLEMSAA